MKNNRNNETCPSKSANGMTLVEVAVSIFVVALFGTLAILIIAKAPKARASQINCISNLKQIGLAMRMWSNDHSEKFPWRVSTNEGGTLELVGTTEVSPHFLATSNELTSPKVLRCPKDAQRTSARTWDQLTIDSGHFSYFVGLDADETKPQSILSGDRNLTTNGRPAVGAVAITRTMATGWTGTMHTNSGNVGFGDGSARRFLAVELQAPFQPSLTMQTPFLSALTNLGLDSIRLVIP